MDTETIITPKDIFEDEELTPYSSEASFFIALGRLLEDLSTHVELDDMTVTAHAVYAQDWYIDSKWPSVVFHVEGKQALVELRELLGGGAKCFDSKNVEYADPQIAGVHPHYGLLWAIKRSDLTCTYEPTGEFEEVTETVTIEEPVTETITSQREIKRKKCQPLLSD